MGHYDTSKNVRLTYIEQGVRSCSGLLKKRVVMGGQERPIG